MAKHEFGIMQTAPERGRRYDDYEPQKYEYISVDDDYVEIIDAGVSRTDFYWHTLDVPAKGLAYTGVTLIPPASIQRLADSIEDIPELSPLRQLCEKAIENDKWIIHFGL